MIHTELVKRAMSGDEEAFELLIKNESEKLYKTAFLYVRNKEDALDVLQETVFKAFISINQLKQPEYFSTWLTKILIRTAYELLRKKKKFILSDEVILNTISQNQSKRIEDQIDIAYAISLLNDHYKTVIILFYYHDLPLRKIAKVMDKPVGTIKTYLHRAKIELKKILEGGKYYGQGMA